MNQVASIYVRETGVAGVKWLNGPYPLEDAHEYMQELAAEALRRIVEYGYDAEDAVLYYELRGLGECLVRYRSWIVSPPAFVRTEVLTRRSPGRRALRNIAENK